MIEKIVKELVDRSKIKSDYISFKKLNGGTTSSLYLIQYNNNENLVIKFNEPTVIQAESYFLSEYSEIPLLPRLQYTEPVYDYIVYSFINGEVNFPEEFKISSLKTLIERIINHYKPSGLPKGWGWVDQSVISWQSFLLSEISDAKESLEEVLTSEDHHLIIELVKKPIRKEIGEPYLLHGDCGVHNMIFHNQQFIGLIDPTPLYGPPIYDLVYAFCSSSGDLSKETFDAAVRYLKVNSLSKQEIYEEVLIGLYIRMARCVRHHPEDLERYIEAWGEWKEVE